MSMKQMHWTFEQETVASTWEIANVPEGAIGAVITHVISTTGLITSPDHQVIAPYGLEISFGVQGMLGTAYGTYFMECEDVCVEPSPCEDTVLCQDGGTIHIHQYNNSGSGSEPQG